MNCMKCGREVEEEQVFCPDCLTLMESDPVHISTAVHIPRQPTRSATPRRSTLHPEDDVRRLERSNEKLRMWVILLALSTVLLAMALYHKEVVSIMDDLGKNYSVVETQAASE